MKILIDDPSTSFCRVVMVSPEYQDVPHYPPNPYTRDRAWRLDYALHKWFMGNRIDYQLLYSNGWIVEINNVEHAILTKMRWEIHQWWSTGGRQEV